MDEKKNKTKVTVNGCGFSGLLTIAFIVLKLCGVISWSWLWVLSPLWIGFAITMAILLIGLIVCAIALLIDHIRY